MIDKGLKYEDQRLTEKQKKKIKPAKQGGGMNYLGKQKTVTVPTKWLSDPDHVVAELAYITPREKKVLIDLNMYGSLKGKPNKGPGGIQSLQGDMGSVGGGSGNNDGGGNDDGLSNRDRFMGLQGKTGKPDPSLNTGGNDEGSVAGTTTTTTTTTTPKPQGDTFIPSVLPSTFYNARIIPGRTVYEQIQDLKNQPKTAGALTADYYGNPFSGLTKDVLNPEDKEDYTEEVNEMFGADEEKSGIAKLMDLINPVKKLGDLATKIGFTGDAKKAFYNNNNKNKSGDAAEGLASIYTGPPALRAIEPVSPIVEEEVVDPRTAEMEAFREILRRNLGLI